MFASPLAENLIAVSLIEIQWRLATVLIFIDDR
jgi:hypothetical protein